MTPDRFSVPRGLPRVLAVGEHPSDSTRAHAVNVTKTAGGFVRLGCGVTLATLAPESGVSDAELAERFGEPALSRRTLPAPGFGEHAAALAAEIGAEMVYARSFAAAEACARAGFRTVVETHAPIGDRNPPLLRTLALAGTDGPLTGVATISASIRAYFVECGADPERVHVVPDGVDLDLFTPPSLLPAAPWRADGRPHAVYAGHLYEYKGIPTLLAAASLLPEWSFELVGGMPGDVAQVRNRIDQLRLRNVTAHGPRHHAEVPRWLWQADAAVLPPLGTDPSARWTSPVKLGEYLASGAAVVASDIPGLRAWVDEPEVSWFRAGDPASLAEVLREVLGESGHRREARRQAARNRAETYCYPRRARRLLAAAGFQEYSPLFPTPALAASGTIPNSQAFRRGPTDI